MPRISLRLAVAAALMLSIANTVFADPSNKNRPAPGTAAAAEPAQVDPATLPPRHLLPAELRNAPWLPEEQDRSALLPALFASYAALQVLDVRSTLAAQANGAREANPLLGNSTAMLGVKLATSAATMFLVHRVAKKHRKAAIITMIVANGVTALVIANNYRNAR